MVRGILMKSQERNLWKWIGLVVGVAVIIRLALLLFYSPVSYDDTHNYRRLAEAILNGWQGYDGTRPPGYPLFLAVMGPDSSVMGGQLGLGLIVTLVLSLTVWKASGSPIFGAAAGLAHTLNLQQVLFEANLLSETLTVFWTVLCLSGVFLWLSALGRRTLPLAVGISLTAGCAALTRSLFVFLPVWLAFFLAIRSRLPDGKWIRPDLQKLAALLLPGLALIGLWVGFIYRSFGTISVSTMNGYHMVQHTGYFFEYVPDEYADVREIYLKYRDQRIAEYGTQGNTIWQAIPELQQATGLSFFELSRLLSKISLRLILEHPDRFAGTALRGWWLFWRGPVYASAESLPLGFQPVFSALVKGTQGGLFLLNLVFLATSSAALVSRKLRSAWKITPFLALLAGTVWVTSILQTLLDHGDNPRFLVPLEWAVVLWVLWVGWYSYAWVKSSRRAGEFVPVPK